MSYNPSHNMQSCGRPLQHPLTFVELDYTAKQINELLSLIPFKADRAEVPEMEKLSDVNYLGHVADATLLPEQEQPSWALVGNIEAARPYFFYVEDFVPKGYQPGWNDLSQALGTYNLTALNDVYHTKLLYRFGSYEQIDGADVIEQDVQEITRIINAVQNNKTVSFFYEPDAVTFNYFGTLDCYYNSSRTEFGCYLPTSDGYVIARCNISKPDKWALVLTSGNGEKPKLKNYNSLTGRPAINGVTLSGNHKPAELDLATLTEFNTLRKNVSEVAANAEQKSDNAVSTSNEAKSLSVTAESNSEYAVETSNEAKRISETAKNAVATLQGLSNANEAMQTLAVQVVQIEENKQNIATNKADTDAKLSELGSNVGVSNTFNIDSSFNTSVTVDVSNLSKGEYYVKPIMEGINPPSDINIYRTRGNQTGLIEPLYTNCASGKFIKIDLTEETNWLWFWKADKGFTYNLSFELYSVKSTVFKLSKEEEVLKEDIENSKKIISELDYDVNGIRKTYNILSSEQTDRTVNVATLPKGKYFVKLIMEGSGSPSNINIYRSKSERSGLIEPLYTNCVSGEFVEIELTEETNWLWFWKTDKGYEYTLSFELYSEESIKGRLHSIEVVGMDNKDTIQHILNNISEKKYTELQVEEIKEGSVLNSVGNIEYHSSYSVETYSLDGINRIRVHGIGGTTTIRTYGFFKSSNINSENLIEIGPVHTQTYDYEVDVPEGATHIACTKYMYQTLKVYSVGLGDIKPMETTESSTILYTVENKRVWVSTASGIKQIVVGIQANNDGEGNGLPDIRSIGTADLGIIPSDGSVNVLHYSSSDWIAPFKIRAVNNADGDDVSGDTFTGGSHQYNNQITGSTPTARLVSMKTYIDGKSVSSGSGYCSSIEVEWVARIQGSNTRKSNGSGREILEEKVTFTFDGKEWKVRTTLLPLEDLYMDRWYGYQFTGINTIFNTWRYVNGATREDNIDSSGNDKTIAMFAEGEEVSLEMWVDTTIDLGNRELCKNSGLTRSAFKSGNKGYFWIVDNSEVLKANDRYYLEGKYIIKLK